MRLARSLAIAAVLCGCTAPVLAEAIYPDPIVRVRSGGTSIPITSLPFVFDWGAFNQIPDPPGNATDCSNGSDADADLGYGPVGADWVSCSFQNLTGKYISQLDFLYSDDNTFIYVADDWDSLFGNEDATSAGASFSGGGIAPGFCDIEFGCFGGEFIVDLIGFSEGTEIQMTAAPEPGALLLLGTGAAIAGLMRRRR